MTRKIPIFSAEKEDGIEDLIKAKSSVAYFAELVQAECSDVEVGSLKIPKAVATNLDQDDLFYLEAILVTTCDNLNDDVFIASETWAARSTPEDKPINIGHVNQDIVGHMTSVRAIDESGKTISDNTPADKLPSKFHLATSGVLYKVWSDEDQQERVDNIIDGIVAGKQFVSMECMFHGFDYLVADASGKKIVTRDSATAFLTKHLRAYGGTGTFEGKKVQRVLRNIAFIGKGIVEKPANPESVFLVANITKETDCMPNTDNSQQIDDLKAELKEAKASLTEANKVAQKQADDAVKAKVEKLEATIADLKASSVTLKEKVVSVEATLVERDGELTEAKADVEKKQAELTKIEAEAKTAGRIAQLVKAGKTEDEAIEFEKKFSGLDDEAFAGVLELIPAKAEETETEEVEDDTKGEESVGDTDLENETSEEAEAGLTEPTNEGDEEATKSLASFMGSFLKGNTNKEEVAQ